MTTLRRRMLVDLQLRGLAPKTQQGYLAAVHQRAQHERHAPDQLSVEDLRSSVGHLRRLSRPFGKRVYDDIPHVRNPGPKPTPQPHPYKVRHPHECGVIDGRMMDFALEGVSW